MNTSPCQISEQNHASHDLQARIEGVGIGLRLPHIQQWITDRPEVDWLEIHSCNFLSSPTNLALLRQLSDDYPLSFHGVSMNLGGTDELDYDYLGKLKQAVNEFKPALISDHACFTALGDRHFHDLLPLPYTQQAVSHLADRIGKVQDFIGQKILLENVSRYYSYPHSQLPEADFLNAVADKSQCGLLLDLNNAYVNQCNHGESAARLIRDIDLAKVEEIHLGGFHREGNVMIDSHSAPVNDAVWSLLADYLTMQARAHHMPPPILIEWDNQLPELQTLINEQQKAKRLLNDFYNCHAPRRA